MCDGVRSPWEVAPLMQEGVWGGQGLEADVISLCMAGSRLFHLQVGKLLLLPESPTGKH